MEIINYRLKKFLHLGTPNLALTNNIMIGIITFNKQIGDKIIEFYKLNLDDKNSNKKFSVYKNHDKVFVVATDSNLKNEKEALIYLYTEFNPEFIFYFGLGQSVSNEHIIGDVILPNTFMKYNPEISKKTELTKKNRDKFMKDPIFIENYTLQKDYNFTTFGFSIGGICISGKLKDDEIMNQIEKIHMAYEADVFDDLSYSFVEEAKNLEILSKIYVINAIEKGNVNSNLKDKDNISFAIENGMNILKFIVDSLSLD